VSTLTRILATFVFATFTVGPVSAATVFQSANVVAQATGSVQGTAVTSQGAPIPGANVNLSGPHSYSTTTDATGAFSIPNIVPGIYRLTVTKPGYQTAQNDIAVVAGAPQVVGVTMPAATFTTLRTIAHVSVNGRGVFNTSTASVNTLTSADFQDQGQFQVDQTLDEIPGLQIASPSSSANGGGGIRVPSIRGALSDETATLIDGHPLAVVDYGDYVTTFLLAPVFSDFEVIKGPGAMSPETNYAIGGTLNMHTKDPTLTFTPDYTFGYLSNGSVEYNMGVSDTILNGRLGFVVDLAGLAGCGEQEACMRNQSTYFNPESAGAVIGYSGGYSGNIAGFNDSKAYFGDTESYGYLRQGLVACCYQFNGYDDLYADLFKLQYHFSDTTRATVSFLSDEAYEDQDANTASTLMPVTFAPASGHGYNGSFAPGTQYWQAYSGPYDGPGGTADETNSEPIVQAEIASAIGDNTVLARYYHASINRTIDEGTDSPFVPDLADYTYYGVNQEGSNYTTYNGTNEPTALFDYFRQYELDRLNGYSFEFTHPYAEGDEFTLSAESTVYQTDGVGYIEGCSPGYNSAGQFVSFSYAATSGGGCPNLGYLTPGTVGSGAGATQATTLPIPGIGTISTTVPGGSSQIMNTYMFRDITNITQTLQFTVALYENTYHNTYANECLFTPGWYGATKNSSASPTVPNSNLGEPGATCAPNGSNVLPYYDATTATWLPGWVTDTQRHFDDRFALEWRPHPNLAVRLAAGSPEYLAELTKPTGYYASCTATCQSLTVNYNNPNLVPETSFGYDIGADYRFHDNDTFLSVDLYSTNLFNHFVTALNYSGFTIPYFAASGGCNVAAGCPVYFTENENLSNARFQGIEAVLKHIPQYGFGWRAQGSLEHAYAYNIPANFYCTFTSSTAKPCVPANYNTNLSIIAGQNFTGNGGGADTGYYSTACGYQNPSFSSTCSNSLNGFSNTSIPYLTGNAEINWTGHSGMKVLLGSTLFGKNNSWNAPPFWETYASLRVPLNSALSFQVSGYNIFNALPGYYEYLGTGVQQPLADGQQAVTVENQLGPAVYTFELTKTFDGP
jgi:hypothetical protein